jgi:hypothetical protein
VKLEKPQRIFRRRGPVKVLDYRNHLTETEAIAKINELIRRAKDGERFAIGNPGEKQVIIISFDEYVDDLKSFLGL